MAALFIYFRYEFAFAFFFYYYYIDVALFVCKCQTFCIELPYYLIQNSSIRLGSQKNIFFFFWRIQEKVDFSEGNVDFRGISTTTCVLTRSWEQISIDFIGILHIALLLLSPWNTHFPFNLHRMSLLCH